MIQNISARVVDNRLLITGYWQIILKASEIARNFEPGQFVSIQCAPGREPLLKRPLSIYKADPQKRTITLVYKVVGAGTELLSRAKTGSELEVIGPLGRGFRFSGQEKKIILVAGGLGMVPLLPAAKKIIRDRPATKITFFWGAGTGNHFILKNDFVRLGVQNIRLATDDGSTGFHGQVTRLLEKHLSDEKADLLLACGPGAMLKNICQISGRKGILAQVSLEARMACGYGVCVGCVINTVSGYQKVCDAGPVFEAGEIVWP